MLIKTVMKSVLLHKIYNKFFKSGQTQGLWSYTHTNSPFLLRTRKKMSTMRSTMIKMPRKEPITIPATSPPLKHTSEIEGMVSQRGELIKIMSLEAQTNKRRQRKK